MDGAGTGALPTRAPADAGSDAAGQHRLLCGRHITWRCDATAAPSPTGHRWSADAAC